MSQRPIASRSVLFLILSLPWLLSPAAGNEEDYQRAEKFLRQNASKLVFNLTVTPNWIGESDRFWYRVDGPDTHRFLLVDPEQDEVKELFDHETLAKSLATETKSEVDAKKLPFKSLEFDGETNTLTFDVGQTRWRCKLENYELEKITKKNPPVPHELESPDGKFRAFVRDHDLYLRESSTGKETRLTFDGEKDYGYGESPDTRLSVVREIMTGIRLPPSALWSADSNLLLAYRLDQRQVGELHLLQSVPNDGTHRTRVFSYRHPQPGDFALATVEYFLFDLRTLTKIPVKLPPHPTVFMTPLELQGAFFSDDARRLYLLHQGRGAKSLSLIEVDTRSGETHTIMEEESDTYVDPHSLIGARPNVRVLSEGREIVWFSERDGWGHLYLHESGSGGLINRITKGEGLVRDIIHVDEKNRTLYFTAGGLEPDSDPYYQRLYRASLDGSRVELLTPEEADHQVVASPSGRYFLDTYSRVDLPPITVLRSAQGRVICELSRANIAPLIETGWRYPERFKAKARDGKTDIYGVIYRPSNFDPEKTYPVVDSIYPGPQVNRVPASFAMAFYDAFGEGVSLAELGFVVVAIDGMGTPLRSKAFHDVSYGKLGEAGGLEDHIAALRQLKEKHPYLDLDRVGIYGHSGGGYASARALLAHPDFYKVAVSSAGNHDQRGYIAVWGERYHGLPDGGNYEDQANVSLAKNLRGKLLLAHGDLDDNVSPVLTMRLVDALIQANKDFDLLILPNQHHGFGVYTNYFTRRKWDYFVRHLLGKEPPRDYMIGRPKKKEEDDSKKKADEDSVKETVETDSTESSRKP